MERNENGRFVKDTNKSVVSYKLTEKTKLKLRSVMQMLSVNDSVNYDEMFSILADFYIDQTNVNIQKRRKKLTENKDILEKLEGKIERKLERIYKNHMKDMWRFAKSIETNVHELDMKYLRSDYKFLEESQKQILVNEKIIKDTNERVQILLENEPARNDNLQNVFSDFKNAIDKIIDNFQNQKDRHTEQTIEYIERQMQEIIRILRIRLDLETESEKIERLAEEKAVAEKKKQAEAKIKAEKERETTRIRAEVEEKRKIEESKKLKWFNSAPDKTTILVTNKKMIATKGFLGKITYTSEIVNENLTYDDVEVLYRQYQPKQKIRLYKDKTPPTEQKPIVVVYEFDGKEIKREIYESYVAFGNTKKTIFEKFDKIFWEIEILATGKKF